MTDEVTWQYRENIRQFCKNAVFTYEIDSNSVNLFKDISRFKILILLYFLVGKTTNVTMTDDTVRWWGPETEKQLAGPVLHWLMALCGDEGKRFVLTEDVSGNVGLT